MRSRGPDDAGLFLQTEELPFVGLGHRRLSIVDLSDRGPSPLNVMAIMIFVMWLVDTVGLHPSLYPSYQWYVWGFIGLSLRGLDWEPVARPIEPGPSMAIGVGRKDKEETLGHPVSGRRAPARRPLTRKV